MRFEWKEIIEWFGVDEVRPGQVLRLGDKCCTVTSASPIGVAVELDACPAGDQGVEAAAAAAEGRDEE